MKFLSIAFLSILFLGNNFAISLSERLANNSQVIENMRSNALNCNPSCNGTSGGFDCSGNPD